MASKTGPLITNGPISVSQVNTHAGRSATERASLGDTHMRAFQGNREAGTPTSLGDARGRTVTYRGFIKSSGIGSNVSIPTFSLTQFFHPSQLGDSATIYITSEITDDWWGALDEPRNINATMGNSRAVRHGGTGGRKNYYCETNYYNNKTMNLRGYYSGKSTKGRQGRVHVAHLSLLDAGHGKLS